MSDLQQKAESVEKLRQTKVTVDAQKKWWKEIEGEKAVSHMIGILVVLIAGIESGEINKQTLPQLVQNIQAPPSSSRSSPSAEQIVERHAAQLSVYFLSLFQSFTVQSTTIRAATSKLSAVKGPLEDQPFYDLIFNILSKEKNDQACISLVQECIKITLPENLKTSKLPATVCVAPSMIHCLLIQLCNSGRRSQLIVETTIRALNERNLPDSEVLVLLLMLTTFISTSPLLSRVLLNSALPAVQPYYLRPRPVGLVAQRVLRMLSLECAAPGAALRALCDTSAAGAKERCVHVLLAPGHASNRVQATLRASHEQEYSARQIQQMLLAPMFTQLLKIDVASVLSQATAETIATTYTQAVEVLEQSVLRVGNDADNYRVSQLKMVAEQLRRAPPSKQGAVRPARSLPPIQFNTSSFALDRAVDDDVAIGELRLPNRRSLCNTISQILAEHLPFASATHRPLVRLLVSGGDDALHCVTGAIVVLRLTKPKLFSDLDLRLLVLPTDHANSGFAAYLSRVDAWYGRHGFLGSHAALHCFPALPTDGSESERLPAVPSKPQGAMFGIQALPSRGNQGAPVGSSDSFWPGALLRLQLSNYARFATHVLPVMLFKCECYHRLDAPPITVPFFSRVELGIAANAVAFQNGGGCDPQLSLDDVISTKSFKFTAPVVGLSFKHMTVRGMPRDADPLRAVAYHTLVLANHWQPTDDTSQSPPAHPTQRWLELYAYESDSKKKRREPPIVHHVGQTIIESDARRPFDVLLDSVHYGPFVKCVVKPLDLSSSDDEGLFTLPVACFSPPLLD